ncbi:MAG: SDR family oxidoreductase [Deltaproteobacteria bacterium]|nr:SDR family oxidoreductase [Deltaproteobacteria bacterium]
MAVEKIIAIPGGAGYIGCVLARHLLDCGYGVRVLDRCFFGEDKLGSCLDDSEFELVKIDTRDVDASHLEGCWGVIDLAGLSNDPSCELDPGLTSAINVDGQRRVLDAAKAAGVRRMIYQSSCSVYGSGGGAMLTEESPLTPVSAYARSKVECEEACRAASSDDFEVVITRAATIHGLAPRMRFDLIINIMTMLAERDGRIFVLGGGQQWRPLLHVRDMCIALQLLVDAPADKVAGQTFNVGHTDHNYRVSRVAKLVAGIVGGTDIVVAPDDPDKRSYRVDCSRFERAFDFGCTVPPETSVEEILEALRSETVDTGLMSKTVQFYKYLLEAKDTLDRVILAGRLL